MSNEHEYNRLKEQACEMPFLAEEDMQRLQLVVLLRIAIALERFVELAERETGGDQ